MGPLRLAAVGILAALEIAFAARLIFALARTDVAGWCSKTLWPLVRRTCRGCGKADDMGFGADEAARRKAEALLGERTVRFTRSLIFGASLVFFLRSFTIILEVTRGGLAAGFDERTLLIIGYGQACCVSGSCCPQLVRPRVLWVWHWLLMGMVIAYMSPWGIGAVALRSRFYGLTAHMVSVVFGLVGMGASSAFVSNALLFVSIAANVARNAGANELRHVLITECAGYAFKVALISAIHGMMRYGTKQEVLVSMQNCHRQAMSSLLDLICDAVVDLDDSLTMTEHFPKLGNMLMHRPGRSLSGTPLADFTVEEAGCEDFESRIRRDTEGQDGVALAGMFVGAMRDSIGNRLGVVFFHVPYTTIAGVVHHLIGIQEKDVDAVRGDAGGDGAWHSPAEPPEPPPRVGPALPEAVLREDVAQQVGHRRGRMGARSGGGSRRSSSSGSSGGGNAITVDVFVAEGLPIRGADDAFRTSLGLERRPGHFLEVLADADVGSALSAWIRARAEAVLSGAVPVPHVETFSEEVEAGTCRRRLRALFPPREPYCVSLRLERQSHRGVRGPTVGRGTSAIQEAQGLEPDAPTRMHL